MKQKPDNIKYFVFDLDGTLVNTLDDIGESVNIILREENLPEHSMDEYKYFVGNGMKMLVTRALPEDMRSDEYIEHFLQKFLDYYKVHYLDKTCPYDKMVETVTCLKNRGIQVAVVTNKTHKQAVEIVEKFFGDVFDIVLGNTSEFPLKPAPDATFKVMEMMGATQENTVFVGDSSVDMQTAKNAGLYAVGVLWGFRTADELEKAGADILVSNADGLLELI